MIAAHHPDRLHRPQVSPTAPAAERVQQALLWNVFRTLELITPSFWLRRIHVRLTAEASLVPPQIARVRLWPLLPRPWVQSLDGTRRDVAVDVVIETEHAVWTMVADVDTHALTDGERAAAVVDAGAWFAGTRRHHCGVIESPGTPHAAGPVLQSRYSRSRDSTRLRSGSRGPSAPAPATWGTLRWSQLAVVLADCVDGTSLSSIERAVAANALEWLTGVGVEPERRQPSHRSFLDGALSDEAFQDE